MWPHQIQQLIDKYEKTKSFIEVKNVTFYSQLTHTLCVNYFKLKHKIKYMDICQGTTYFITILPWGWSTGIDTAWSYEGGDSPKIKTEIKF